MVLSNRLPFTVSRGPHGLERKPSVGGLVSALDPVLRRRGGSWIGWPGGQIERREKLARAGDPYEVVPVSLSTTEVNRYYHGFSNRTLWPLFHSLPARAHFDRRDWESYEAVNARFAEASVPAMERGELAWVHDYHLMLAPALMREMQPDSPIAFFMHIPFPPYDIFRLLPWDRELLHGLLACDLVGFHVRGYADNFLDCVEKRLGARVDRDAMQVEYSGRTVKVGAFPIGIEFGVFQELAQEAPPSKEAGRERIVLGVDRLDYTKGIPERILAFERLLELYPSHRGNTVLLQLAVPSRSQVVEYRDLKRQIDEMVGRINGRFASADWSPIRYLYRTYPRERLAGLYRDADVALITPLRDGMNLVAKEFVASQVHDPGVLVLSRLAGAAETMQEALAVNPYDVDETAEAIHRALTMDDGERASRMAALQRRERKYDLERWVQSFLEALDAGGAGLQPLSDAEVGRWLSDFIDGHRLALFLDYDGTLTPIVEHPSQAKLSKAMRDSLDDCAARDDTDVSIISGRSIDDVEKLVDNRRLTFAGNHGLEIRGPDLEEYRHSDVAHFRPRIERLAAALDKVSVGGAWVESKGLTLTYHVRAVDEDDRPKLMEKARQIILDEGFQARDAHCAIEARPPIGWDKGQAVLHILRARYGPAWPEIARVIYIGDDQTDEDAFRLLSGLGLNFRVGPAETLTLANRRLRDVNSVGVLLRWVGQRPPS